MALWILTTLLLIGGLYSLFDGSDREDDDEDDLAHGGPGNDTLSADHGTLAGWRGDDRLTVTDGARGFGNEGNDTIVAFDDSRADGGEGDDRLAIYDQGIGLGGAGADSIFTEDQAIAYGGIGDDGMTAYDTSTVYGGDGDDDVATQNQGTAYGDAGNDLLDTYAAQNGLPLTPRLFGGTGDDILARGAHLDGGLGDDWLALGAEMFGGAGNDILSYGQDVMNGGAGNDLIYMDRSFAGGTATGGAGQDIFVANAVQGQQDIMTITDFTKGQDQLAILVPRGLLGANVMTEPPTYSIAVNQAGGYTDVTVTVDALPTQDANRIDYSGTTVIRLMGVTDLTANDIVYVMNGGETGSFGTAQSMAEVRPSTPNADQIAETHVVQGTAGVDDVTAGLPSAQPSIAAWLGAGDDSFTAGGQAHFVSAGAGDDHYVGAAPAANNAHAATDPATLVQMGDGNDLLEIGQGQGRFVGGAGNDSFETSANTGGEPGSGPYNRIQLEGDDGDDVFQIGSGGTAIEGGEGNDAYTFIVSDQSLASGTNSIFDYMPGERLRIEIPAEMTGEVRFVDHDEGGSAGLVGTWIYLGDQPIVYVNLQGSGQSTGLQDGINNVAVVRT